MDKDAYLRYCAALPGAAADQPFSSPSVAATWVVRHRGNRRWFAAVMTMGEETFVNLKCDPLRADFLRGLYRGIRPAYHMNKWHWNSVYLGSDVPDALVRELTEESYRLTAPRPRPAAPSREKKRGGKSAKNG